MSRIVCSICFDIVSSKNILLHLECGHIYHDECLTQWMNTSRTCPDCRKQFSNQPSRIYPNFDMNDDDLLCRNKNLEERITHLNTNHKRILEIQQLLKRTNEMRKEKLIRRNEKLVKDIRELQIENKKLDGFVTENIALHQRLSEKTYEFVKVKTYMESQRQLFIGTTTKNDELTRVNEEYTEQLNSSQGKLNSAYEVVLRQQNEIAALTARVIDLEKRLQFAESDAQMDKYFRTVEVIEQLNDTQRQLFSAEDTIHRNALQIKTILFELVRTETELQTLRMRQMEQMQDLRKSYGKC